MKLIIGPLGVLALRVWLEERSGGHRLIIESLSDLIASCSCGGWSLSRTTTSRDNPADLQRAAEDEHGKHVKGVVQRERQAVKDSLRGMGGE